MRNAVAVIFYHKNVSAIYQPEWIKQCVDSVKAQTFQDFDILELNYGGTDERYTDGEFFSIELENHIFALNFLITYAFARGYEIVMNTNMDDHYEPQRFEKQIGAILNGAQLVSSNFRYFGAKEMKMPMTERGDIWKNLQRGHNVIAHPCVAMHRSFWDADLHYKNQLGSEDLELWQRAYMRGKKFEILPDYLLHYRHHSNQVTKFHPK